MPVSVVASALCLLLAAAAAGPGPAYGQGRRIATLANVEVHESSGIATSRTNDDVFWTHNDSGDGPRLFAFGRDGTHRATVVLEGDGVQNIDWEDVASFVDNGRGFLLVADVGDNERKRETGTLYVVPEPVLGPVAAAGTIRVAPTRSLRFRYEDGPHDCESAAFDPRTGVAYLVTKEKGKPAGVYALSCAPAEDDGECRAKLVGRLDVPRATGMDISPDGLRAVLLTGDDAREYRRAPGEPWEQGFVRSPRRIPLPARVQGEAICYGPDGATLYLTSECGKRASGACTPLFEVPVTGATPGPTPEP